MHRNRLLPGRETFVIIIWTKREIEIYDNDNDSTKCSLLLSFDDFMRNPVWTMTFCRLLEELVNVQRAYQELIQMALRENRLRVEQLRDQLQRPVPPVAADAGNTADSFPGNSANFNALPMSLPSALGHSAVGIRYIGRIHVID